MIRFRNKRNISPYQIQTHIYSEGQDIRIFITKG